MNPVARLHGVRLWLPRRVIVMLLIPAALLVVGTLGYYYIEDGWTLFDGLYMTVITLTTTGYGEVHELSTAGRTFTIFLSLGGVFSLFYAAAELIRSIVSGEVAEALGKQQMEQALRDLSNHVIVCGYGRMGKMVCHELSRDHVAFVVVDKAEPVLRDFKLPFGIPLVGDATADATLRQAGIDRARALVTVMASDAENVFTTLSARLLNQHLFIVARVESGDSELKLKRAGANRIVSPYQIGGSRVAQAILRPTVLDFIDLATATEHIELQMEETRVAPSSPLNGANLKDSRLRADLKVIIVAIKKAGGHMQFNPAPDTVIEAGDTLIAIGHKEQVLALDRLARPKER
jgi:voltage-gated potassium channel